MNTNMLEVFYSPRVAQYPADGLWYLAISARCESVPDDMSDALLVEIALGALTHRFEMTVDVYRFDEGRAMLGSVFMQGRESPYVARAFYDECLALLTAVCKAAHAGEA